MDDGAFDEMVRRFDAVLRREMMLKDAAAAVDVPVVAPPASVGEKRSHSKADEEAPSKRGRSGSEWMLFFTQASPKKQRYMYNIVDDRIEQYVRKGRADNLYISSVASSGNLWALVMESNRNFSDQVYLLSPAFLYKEWIVDKWNAGYSITAVAGNSRGKSLIVMSKGTPFEQQSYRISKTFPLKWIRKKWRQGFFITSLATSGKYWAVVTSKTKIFKYQVVEMDCMYSKDRFRRLQNRGLFVNALGTTQDQGVVVFSELEEPLPAQKIMYAPTFPSSQVKEQWKINMYISGLSYGRTSNFEGKGVKFGMNRSLSQPQQPQQPQQAQQLAQQQQQQEVEQQAEQQQQQAQQEPQQQIALMEMENLKIC